MVIPVLAITHCIGLPVSFPGYRSWVVIHCLLNHQGVNFTAHNFQCVRRAWWRSRLEWLCWGVAVHMSGGLACSVADLFSFNVLFPLWNSLQNHLHVIFHLHLPHSSLFILLLSYICPWINVFYCLIKKKVNCDTIWHMRDSKDRK